MELHQKEHHPYDKTLKALFGKEADLIVPQLLPGASHLSEKNVELDRSTLRVDQVYDFRYHGQPAVLNIEFQTDTQKNMHLRALKYSVLLFEKYKLPVFSLILYTFEVKVQEQQIAPFEMRCDEKLLMIWYHDTVKLWLKDAREFVSTQVIYMYTFLPVMQHATAALLLQAIEEMDAYYEREVLRSHLIHFYRFLQKS